MCSNRFTKEEFLQIVLNSKSIADICRAVGWKPQGGNYRVIHKYIEEFDIDTSHFIGQKSNLNNQNRLQNEKPLQDYLENGKLLSGPVILKKMIKSGLKERKCEKCGRSEWEGETIPLQIHHIDGNNRHNDLENLQILCPNCHALTDNYAGKKQQKTRYCRECNKEISKWSKSGLCTQCASKKQRKVERPDKETLAQLIQNNSVLSIGRQYGVSDNTIRKWCKYYGIIVKKKSNRLVE